MTLNYMDFLYNLKLSINGGLIDLASSFLELVVIWRYSENIGMKFGTDKCAG